VKFTKASWIFLIIGVLVIAAASLGMAHSQQIDQQKKLESDLASAKQKVAVLKMDDLVAQKSALVKQVGELGSQYKSTVSKIFNTRDSISTSEVILSTAREASVAIQDMKSGGATNGKLADIDCITLPVTIKVQGTLSSISDFVNALSVRFPTSVVNTVRVSAINQIQQPAGNPEGTPDPTPTTANPASGTPVEAPKNVPTHTADVNMIIYSYKGG
jgi:hypothetical protein